MTNPTPDDLRDFFRSDIFQVEKVFEENYDLAIAEFYKRFGWREIETAPKDGTRVLAWNEDWTAPNTVQYYGIKGWGSSYEEVFKFQPTHWMPLPQPPTSGHS